MTELFLGFLNRGVAAGWLVLAVVLVRALLRRAPKWADVLLWGMVALRLVLPFSVESVLSLLPSAETVRPEVVRYDPAPTITSGVRVIDDAVNPALRESFAADPAASVNPLYVWTEIAGIVWLLGVAALLGYTLVSYLRLRRRVRTAVRLEGNVYRSEYVVSPFILGVLRPTIYLPSALSDADRACVLAHERAHLARRDHWWKPLGFLLLALYWFHPLLWLAYALFCRDVELACDERVVRPLDPAQRADYSQALLACSAPRRMVAACPLAFGEVGVKERVKSVLRYKKPAFRVVVLSVLICTAVAVCFLTDPPTDTNAAGLVGFQREQVARVDVTDENSVQTSNVQLTGEETDHVYALLDALQYKHLGTASGMQDCYARLYFVSAAGERCEIMLSQREMLVNPITNGKKARLYELRSGSAELRDYLLECISASDAAEDAVSAPSLTAFTGVGWSILLYDGWEQSAAAYGWRSDKGDAYLTVSEWSSLAEELKSLQGMGHTVEEPDGYYRCVTQEGLSNTVVYLYPAPSGESYCRVEIHWSYNSADESEVELQATQLRTMAESFRFEEGGIISALLRRTDFWYIAHICLGDAPGGAELVRNGALDTALQNAGWSLSEVDASFAVADGCASITVSFDEEQNIVLHAGTDAYQVRFTCGDEQMLAESPELYGFLRALGEEGNAELHDLDDDGCCEALSWASANNQRNIVIYAARDGRVERLDVNETLGCIASDYTGLIANLPREYKNLINAIDESGKGGVLYRYRSGTLEYVTTLDAALNGTVSLTGYPAYDGLLAEIGELRRSGASDTESDFSSDLLAANDYYQSPGWLLYDLDSDGTDELLLGADWGDGHTVIFNIYRLDGAQAVRVVDGWSRSRWYLCADGSLAHEGSGGASESSFSYYRYENGALRHLETLLFLDNGSGGSPWLYSDTTDHYLGGDGFRAVSEEEANAMMSRYTYETLAFAPFPQA